MTAVDEAELKMARGFVGICVCDAPIVTGDMYWILDGVVSHIGCGPR